MASSCSANICNYLKTKGRCYSISSACATSLHNVGHAYEIIKHGICDIVICGGCEEVSPLLTAMFDGINAISKSFNQDPQKASRPYDQRRDGFVMSGGSGIVILEEYERALRRNASIYGEIVGYGACSDGYNLVQPHPEGLGVYSCISEAMKMANCSSEDIDYLNTHGTSTRLGDISEARAIKKIFNGYRVPLSSTKSISGHGIGAAGVQELIYCLLMMENNFITASSNIEALDSEFEDLDIITENKNTSINTFLTNSFGFGGTNACLIVKKNK
jgi:3-oxoacyl-[acyl-carrier-protein] synthase-1